MNTNSYPMQTTPDTPPVLPATELEHRHFPEAAIPALRHQYGVYEWRPEQNPQYRMNSRKQVRGYCPGTQLVRVWRMMGWGSSPIAARQRALAAARR